MPLRARANSTNKSMFVFTRNTDNPSLAPSLPLSLGALPYFGLVGNGNREEIIIWRGGGDSGGEWC